MGSGPKKCLRLAMAFTALWTLPAAGHAQTASEMIDQDLYNSAAYCYGVYQSASIELLMISLDLAGLSGPTQEARDSLEFFSSEAEGMRQAVSDMADILEDTLIDMGEGPYGIDTRQLDQVFSEGFGTIALDKNKDGIDRYVDFIVIFPPQHDYCQQASELAVMTLILAEME